MLLPLIIKNIKVYYIRYIIFGVLLFAICICSVVAINAYLTANSTIEKLKEEFGREIEIFKTGMRPLTKDDVDLFVDTGVISKDTIISYTYKVTKADFSDGSDMIKSYYEMFNILLQGSVVTDKIKLVDGRFNTADSECVVSQNLIEKAKVNQQNLNIGEKITIYDEIKQTSEALTIVGVVNDEELYGTYENNNIGLIYAPLEMVLKFNISTNMGLITNNNTQISFGYNNYYILNSYKDISILDKKFGSIKEINGDYRYFIHYVNSDFYKLTNPLRETIRICTLFMMIIIILALFIIVIVTILGFSERRYDIGVLRCVGMSKPRIISIFTLETLLFVSVVMLVGLFAGSLLSGFFTDGLSAGKYRADNLAVLAQTGILVLLAGLALSLLSSFMSAMFILRYQPMKILRNRN